MLHDNLERALNQYMELLDKRLYFEAHEVLEEVWHPLRKSNHPLKNFIKGVINASIAFEHIKRNRPNSRSRAEKVIRSYERYKILSPNSKIFIQTMDRIENIKKVKKLHV